MQIYLAEIEPFNIPPVDNNSAALFMKYLQGHEAFEFTGIKKPKSLMIYSLKYAYPRHSFTDGYLLSISIDEFTSKAQSGMYPTTEGLLKGNVVGRLHIEYGGTLTEPEITYSSFNS